MWGSWARLQGISHSRVRSIDHEPLLVIALQAGGSVGEGGRGSRIISGEGELRHEHAQEEDVCVVPNSACTQSTLTRSQKKTTS